MNCLLVDPLKTGNQYFCSFNKSRCDSVDPINSTRINDPSPTTNVLSIRDRQLLVAPRLFAQLGVLQPLKMGRAHGELGEHGQR